MKKALENNYGKILAMCKNDFDLAHNVCVYFLESHDEVTDESISTAIDNIYRLMDRVDRYGNSEDEIVSKTHHLILNAKRRFKDDDAALEKYGILKDGLAGLDESDVPDPVTIMLCCDKDVMDMMEFIRRLESM